MSFLSSPASNRQLVLLCARLLVQGVMGCSVPEIGMDALKCFSVPNASVMRDGRDDHCNALT